MKKAGLMAMLLVSIALLFSCSKNNALGPMGDSYDQATMFAVEVVQDYGNGSGQVRVYWIADKMSRGSSPFSFGPLDVEWDAGNLTSTFTTIKYNDKNYYTYLATVKFGKRYHVGAGLSHSGNDINSPNFRWFTEDEQAGCVDYYDPADGYHNMAFTPYSSGTVVKG
jgi:hypothetical protein